MGMFDYITYKGNKYQTRDTPSQTLDNYEIREDGTLWHNTYCMEGPWGYGFGSYRPKNNFLVHSAFFPNSSYQRGLIRNFYFGAAWRAREISKHFTNTDWTEETISRVQKKKAQALDVALEKIQQKDRFRFRP